MSTHDDDFPMMMEREFGAPDTVSQMTVGFGLHPLRDPIKSDKAGHDVFIDCEFVKIATPGDRTSVYFQPASDQHKRRFPRAYQAFKERETKPNEGWPITEWPAISRSMALTLKAANIHTVEALAEVHDGHVDKLGTGGRELRAKAQAALKQATDSAATLKLAAEKAELEKRIFALEAMIGTPGVAPVAPAPAALVDPAVAARKPARSKAAA